MLQHHSAAPGREHQSLRGWSRRYAEAAFLRATAPASARRSWQWWKGMWGWRTRRGERNRGNLSRCQSQTFASASSVGGCASPCACAESSPRRRRGSRRSPPREEGAAAPPARPWGLPRGTGERPAAPVNVAGGKPGWLDMTMPPNPQRTYFRS